MDIAGRNDLCGAGDERSPRLRQSAATGSLQTVAAHPVAHRRVAHAELDGDGADGPSFADEPREFVAVDPSRPRCPTALHPYEH